MMRELRHYVLTCNHSDLPAGMCKVLLQLDAPDETQARRQAREAGWDPDKDLCAAHKSKPDAHSCPLDGSTLAVRGGVRKCHFGHISLRSGEVVTPC